MADFEGPPNVAVTMPADAPAAHNRDDSDDTDSVNIRVQNRMGGFKFFFSVVIVVTALTSALCFFKAVSFCLILNGLDIRDRIYVAKLLHYLKFEK